MKKQPYLMLLSCCLHFFCAAQQQFTHTATKANNSCNYDCTILDVPGLNNNPLAILFVTPEMENGINTNPHPIGVYYFKNQWLIFNLDQKAIPVNSRFKVEYFTKADGNHFQYSIKPEDLQRDGSAFINAPVLNNNPSAQLSLFHSWVPEIKEITNREAINIQYNADSGRWVISNINKKALFARVTYNITISRPGNMVAGIGDPVVSIKDPKKIINSADTTSVIDRPIVKKDIALKNPIDTSYDFSNVNICIDIINNTSLPPKTSYTPPQPLPKINSSGELIPVTTVQQPLAASTDKMWNPGDIIPVGFFYITDPDLVKKIKEYAKVWETYANIKFEFVPSVHQAIIKIGFQKSGSWSALGRNALISLGEQTMNFYFHDGKYTEDRIKGTIIHEFGHALGFIHEHQSPVSGIPWDVEKTYAYFAKAFNWSSKTVDNQVISKYSQSSTNFSTYDKYSIMHYDIPKQLTMDGSSADFNSTLSTMDKQFAKLVYPFPPTPTNATGILRTGDDCDEIIFSVEYNVTGNNNEMEFVLEPGRDANNNLIIWWKKIGIPLKGGIEADLELKPDGTPTIQRLPVAMLDIARGISFAKAKLAGVHTRLGYTWNVLQALSGGCRVKLIWRRDRCSG